MAFHIRKTKENQQADKLRISIMQEDSHKQLFTFSAGKNTMIVMASAFVALLIITTYMITAHTGLRHTIPGYPSAQTRDAAISNLMKIDSLESAIDLWAFQVANIQRVVTGDTPLTLDSISIATGTATQNIDNTDIYSESDSILREEILRQEQLHTALPSEKTGQVKVFNLFKPVNGIITESYNKATNHTYIVISAEANAMVYAAEGGTIISSHWSDSDGYSIFIQHEDNLISIYRHNEKLLKKSGDKVSAGTPIALAGSTGSVSDCPHLRFELWQNGEAIDPSLYINF